MPTCYTAYIENGECTTGNDFLKLCIRNFGVCIGQREDSLSEPLKTHFEYSNYYEEYYKNAEENLNTINKMTPDEIKQAEIDSLAARLEYQKQFLINCEEDNKRYAKIREEVDKWQPPTKDHYEIKEFALNQIDISMHDIDERIEFIDRLQSKLIKTKEKDAVDIKLDKLDELRQLLVIYDARIKHDIQRTDSRNLFMKQFIDSLNEMNTNREV